jgi:hypothetical protein
VKAFTSATFETSGCCQVASVMHLSTVVALMASLVAVELHAWNRQGQPYLVSAIHAPQHLNEVLLSSKIARHRDSSSRAEESSEGSAQQVSLLHRQNFSAHKKRSLFCFRFERSLFCFRFERSSVTSCFLILHSCDFHSACIIYLTTLFG